MKRLPLLFSILACLLICLQMACTQASDRTGDDDDDDGSSTEMKDDKYAAARKTFEAKYPKAKDVDWNTDDHGYLEAEFELDDEKYRADFNEDGSWVETENSIDYDDLPEAVRDAIKRDYDPDDIAEVEQVDNAVKGKFYDVEFKEKGKNKDVMYREDGTTIE